MRNNSYSRTSSGDDARLARLLAEYRADKLNAVSEYIYLSLVFSDGMPLLSEMFDELATDEAEHFKSLGRLLLSLGIDPTVNIRVSNTSIRKSEGKRVNCRGQIIDAPGVMNGLVGAENAAEAKCLALKDLTENADMRSLLSRIADDERSHASTLASAITHMRKY